MKLEKIVARVLAVDESDALGQLRLVIHQRGL